MGHYFDQQPSAPSAPRDVQLLLPDVTFTLTTDRGVFGYGKVDAGTKLLLLKVPAPPQLGDLLDLGCGVGSIALTMAHRAPGATVWAVDVNERARQLCAANAAANGIHNIRAVAPDEVPRDVMFAALWSNPPVRVGKAMLHDVLLRWLPRVTGASHLVVHKHLGADSLQRWLGEHGYPAQREASSGGYRILRIGSAATGG